MRSAAFISEHEITKKGFSITETRPHSPELLRPKHRYIDRPRPWPPVAPHHPFASKLEKNDSPPSESRPTRLHPFLERGFIPQSPEVKFSTVHFKLGRYNRLSVEPADDEEDDSASDPGNMLRSVPG